MGLSENPVSERSSLTRRTVLAAASGLGALSGCATRDRNGDEAAEDQDEPESSHAEVSIDNPYDSIDWDGVERHKSEFHNHPEKWEEPHRVVDLYHGSGEDAAGNRLADGDEYTVFAVADMGIDPLCWPWTDLSSIEGEDRDPVELGVVAFPGAEIRDSIEHFDSIFSTATDDHHEADEQLDAIHQVLDAETDLPKNLAVIGHPHRYLGDSDESWEKYRDHFEQLSIDDGLLGFEILNEDSTNIGFGREAEMPDLTVWDQLLSEFMPERPIWGYGVDDSDDFVIGAEVDRRWTEVLLDSAEFDPSDQEASRQAAMEAYLEGRVFGVERESWDHESEEPPQTPSIDEIAVEDGTISISASAYDAIDWINDGEVVETGESITLTEEETPYVRAELWNAMSVTITQPFGVTSA